MNVSLTSSANISYFFFASNKSASYRLNFVKLNFQSNMSFIWIVLNVWVLFACHRWSQMEFLVIVCTGNETWVYWSDVLGMLLNVNRWLKEIWNISRWCKTNIHLILFNLFMTGLFYSIQKKKKIKTFV
jgi:hypothetical protein